MKQATQKKSMAVYLSRETKKLVPMLDHDPEKQAEARILSIALADPERVKKLVEGL